MWQNNWKKCDLYKYFFYKTVFYINKPACKPPKTVNWVFTNLQVPSKCGGGYWKIVHPTPLILWYLHILNPIHEVPCNVNGCMHFNFNSWYPPTHAFQENLQSSPLVLMGQLLGCFYCILALFLAIASSTALSCLSNSSLLDDVLFLTLTAGAGTAALGVGLRGGASGFFWGAAAAAGVGLETSGRALGIIGLTGLSTTCFGAGTFGTGFGSENRFKTKC